MVDKYKSNAKKRNIFKFFYDKWSIFAVLLSFSGFLYIFIYLKNIGKLGVFTQISFYPHVVFSIVIYFFLLFFYVFHQYVFLVFC
jgi:hypothetical protein